MKHRYVLLFLVIILGLCTFLFMSFYNQAKEEAIKNLHNEQSLHARQAKHGIEDFFNNWTRILTVLAESKHILHMDETGIKNFALLFTANQDILRAITRVDEKGRIIYTLPFNPGLMGKDISHQNHIREIKRTHKPVISDVFSAVQGYDTVALHVPVFKNQAYQGTIAVGINFQALAKRYLEDIRIGQTGYAWMISRNGTELYCPVPGHTGQSVFENCKDFPSILVMAENMLKGQRGFTTYSFDKIRGTAAKSIKKHAAYLPVTIGNTFWSIVVATSEGEVTASLEGFRNKLLLIIALLLLSGVLLAYYGLKVWYIFREDENRRRMEKALRESEEKYRLITENTADVICVLDMNLRFTYISPSVMRISGYTAEEALGKTLDQIMTPESLEMALKIFREELELEASGTADPDRIRILDLEQYKKDGTVISLENNLSILRDRDHKPVGILAVTRDATQRKQAEAEKKRLEEQLQQMQKLESIGTLAGGIAHDFNNLLMGIQGFASLMLLGINPAHPHYEWLKRIEDQVRSGADLTKQLLGFARSGRYEVKPTNINEIIRKTGIMFGRTKREIAVHEHLHDDLWTLDVDRGQMEQVFMNLYINAWQAMPGGGEIFVETENAIISEDQATPNTGIEGRYVKICITDTGVGMDKRTQERIFDPFFTTKGMGRGTGLGLAMVYGIIKGHGGMIEVESHPGRGTTFRIYLPASNSTVLTERTVSENRATGTETILIVDDEETVLAVSQEILKSLGYRVYTARNGQEAIAVYAEHRGEIDLVILDMIMQGMSGGETFDRLRTINSTVKVLLASGYSIEGQAREILDRGCNGFIQKPFQIEMFSQKIRELLARRQGTDPPFLL